MSYLRSLAVGMFAAATVMGASKSAEADSAICYNCPPQWGRLGIAAARHSGASGNHRAA